MPPPISDRNLLLGILALGENFIGSEALVAAMNAWVVTKNKGLGQILREQKAVTENQHALLEESVDDHLAQHGNDVKKSLGKVSADPALRHELEKIADPDVQASLASVRDEGREVRDEGSRRARDEGREARDEGSRGAKNQGQGKSADAPKPLAESGTLELPEPKPRRAAPAAATAPMKAAAPTNEAQIPRPEKAKGRGVPPGTYIAAGAAVSLAVGIAFLAVMLVWTLLRDPDPAVQEHPAVPNALAQGKAGEENKPPPPNDSGTPNPLPPGTELTPVEPPMSRKPSEVVGEGDWRIEGDELVARNAGLKRAFLYFGNKEWTDYDFSFDTSSTTPNMGTMALFRAANQLNHYGLSLGTFLRTKHSLFRVEKGLLTYDVPHFQAPFNANQWYTVRIEARGDQVRCYLDGQEIFDYLSDAHPQGQVALALGPQAAGRWKNIKVTAPDGKLFWDGLPDLADSVPPVLAQDDFVPLFNGKDLSGWKPHPTFAGQWRVENGILIGAKGPLGRGRLETERIQPRDFHLRVEARVSANAIGNVAFRCSQGTFASYEATMSTAHAGLLMYQNPGVAMRSFTRTGDLFHPEPGEWFTLELIAEGDHLITKVNGKVRTDVVDAGPTPAGHIGLTAHTQAAIEFRKIEIKELKAVMPPLVAADGFVPLFNGKDLTGWKPHPRMPGNWRVVNGLLTGTAPERTLNRLNSERVYARDFHLRMEARMKDGGTSKLGFRSPEGTLYGYDVWFSGTPLGHNVAYLHSQSPGVGRGMPSSPRSIPSGQWFSVEVIAKGSRLIVKVDGVTTTDLVDSTTLTAGHLGLGQLGPSTIEIRRIEIKEFNPVPPVPLANEFVPLFNGKDLAGWKTHPKQPGDWRVKDGVLTGIGPAPSSLYTERADYQDYHLHVEARINDGGVGGVFSRGPFGPLDPFGAPNSPNGFLATINSNGDYFSKTGSMILIGGKMVSGSQPPPPPGEWFAMDIIAEGPLVKVVMNGKTTANIRDFNGLFPRGHVALSVRSPKAMVEFRKIEIKELNPGVAPPPPVVADGFVPLFNGKDLTGWQPHNKYPGKWRVENGILGGTGPQVGYLATTRDHFKDFHLRVEARFDDAGIGGDGGVLFRSSLDLLGYETHINHPIKTTGNTYVRAKTHLRDTGASSVRLPPGQWFTLEIVAVGERLVISANGKMISTVVDRNREFTEGRITLRHSAQALLEFRKIEIKELNADAPPPVVAAGGFVPLFNGKDLTGWKPHPQQPADWRVENGILTGDAGFLFSNRDHYKDFHLRLELRRKEGSFGGVMFRYALEFLGYEAGLAETLLGRANVRTRSAVGENRRDIRNLKGQTVIPPPGQWITLEIIAEGTRLRIKVNGQTATDVDDKTGFLSGHIALRGNKRDTEFRKIEIKEIKEQEPVAVAPLPKEMPGKDAPPFPAEAGFVSLFNGKDLTGWKIAGGANWRVLNGILTGSGRGNLRYLATPRDDYGDFHLRLEARLNDDGHATVAFRYPYGPAEIEAMRSGGYTLRLTNFPTDFGKTGSLMVHEKVGTRNLVVKERLVGPGQWFNLEIIARGNQVDVLINGQKANSFLNPKTHLLGGRIVLGYADNFNRQTVVEYRKIKIKEYKAVPAPPQPAPPRPLEDFTPVFNGKDLAGWRMEGNNGWKWNDAGELIGQGPDTALITKRTDYRNLIARIELSASADAEAFLGFRETQGPGARVIGMTSRLTGDGAVVRAGNSGVNGEKNESGNPLLQVKPDEVFRLEFHLKQDHLRVYANGKITASLLHGLDRHPPGAIGLHIVKGTVRIKKFEISAEAPINEPQPAPLPPPLAKGGDFVPLFNGKDLTGWQPHAKRPGAWRVENGILTGAAPAAGSLYTTRGDYADYHLRAVARINDKGFGRVLCRVGLDHTKIPLKIIGYEILLNLRPVGAKTGSLTATSILRAVPVPAKESTAQPGEWFLLEVLARGEQMTVKVNGVPVAEFTDEKRQFAREGHIALHQDINGVIEFRTVEIKEFAAAKAPEVVPPKVVDPLPPPKAIDPPAPKIVEFVPPKVDGMVPLFNGKDLTGWQPHAKRPGAWRVENGILTGAAPAAGALYTTRGDYTDFHLRAEARINDQGFGRIFFRAAYDPTKVPLKTIGYEAFINQRPVGAKTGALTATSVLKSMSIPAKEDTVQPGKWFTLEILAKGEEVTIQVNGVTVAEFTDEKGQFAKGGHIVLHQDPNAVIEFRKVEIKELGPPR